MYLYSDLNFVLVVLVDYTLFVFVTSVSYFLESTGDVVVPLIAAAIPQGLISIRPVLPVRTLHTLLDSI